MKKFLLLVTFIIFMGIPFAPLRAECSLPIGTPFSAIPLFKTNFLGLLENENRLTEICPTQDQACVNNALLVHTDKIPVYDRPAGKPIADLEVTYTPGKGITATLIQDTKSFSFTPPIHDTDWGYGPWFHATLLDQNGVWKHIVLPPVGTGWLELAETESIQLTESDAVYVLNGRNIVILKSSSSILTVRDEQPSDMWCGDGDAPPFQTFKEEIILIDKVYDNQCTLLLSPAYKRGC